MATPPRFDACHRFFAINELVTIFLENASPRVLLNGQRVCKVWNIIICDSETLQQNLFSTPDTHLDESELNPFIEECFGSILSVNTATPDRMSSSSDLQRTPWASGGTDLQTPTRQAFARKDALWRRMLVCQPPINRLGWWHQWKTSPVPSEENEDTYADPFNVSKGWGHQDLSNKPVTLAMVWDMVEARLFRGCRAKVLYYPHDSKHIEDRAILAIEQAAQMADRDQANLSEVPRVMIHTAQVWSRRPTGHERFSETKRDWTIPEVVQLRKIHPLAGDGFNILRADCLRNDTTPRPCIPGTSSQATRWSQSEDANSWNDTDGKIYYGIGARQAGRATVFVARPTARGGAHPTVFAAVT
ncbi:hypothetical protein CLAFUW4_14066 [Fulvia fulva]|nr:hypothetical protein CLAFUR4_14069 [Fulvia fulva]WPV21840.1 hypothetical protein CLAFUW4_14066 [Fulvia fulva]